jgi:signal transduction histidine kinase
MGEYERGRVLIAEDDYLVSRMLQSLLVQRGYDIVGQASDGAEAITMTEELEPDVVVMDVQMPDINGLEASRRIQETTPTPIVVLTAYERLDLVEMAADAGVGAYLVKPPNARELERAIIIARARFDDLRKLRSLNQELSQANEDLDAFSHTVAHDLKHFLAPVLGFAEVLYEDYGKIDIEDARSHLSYIINSARDMNNVIEGLLLLAHVRKGQVERKPVDMGRTVLEALRHLDHMINETGARVEMPAKWPMVLGHKPWIVEVWINYLSNALKYGGDRPRIELDWQRGIDDEVDILSDLRFYPATSGDALLGDNGSIVNFWVRDHGSGISKERLPTIFGSFSSRQQTEVRGHGLGLSIVKRIVDKLGGQVWVESELGRGSAFGFTLEAQPGSHVSA